MNEIQTLVAIIAGGFTLSGVASLVAVLVEPLIWDADS